MTEIDTTRLMKYQKALALALYYVESEGVYNSISARIDDMLKDEPTWTGLESKTMNTEDHIAELEAEIFQLKNKLELSHKRNEKLEEENRHFDGIIDHQARTMQSMSDYIVKLKEENAQLKEFVREIVHPIPSNAVWISLDWLDKARKLLGE